jgi:hypothetical protein
MKLYEVIFTDTREPEGDGDAVFLVRAEDFRSAVAEVIQNSGRREHCSVLPHTVFEIGEEARTRFNSPDRRILRGPYFERAFNFGWREWRRRDLEQDKSEVGGRNEWDEVLQEV